MSVNGSPAEAAAGTSAHDDDVAPGSDKSRSSRRVWRGRNGPIPFTPVKSTRSQVEAERRVRDAAEVARSLDPSIVVHGAIAAVNALEAGSDEAHSLGVLAANGGFGFFS